MFCPSSAPFSRSARTSCPTNASPAVHSPVKFAQR
jgi:hypothetical protein